MAIKSYYFNALYDSETGTYDRTYDAEDFANYLNLLVGNGVFPTPSDNLQVRASSGMNIVVNAGSGWIKGHKMDNTADLTMAVDAADVLLYRKDRVVFYLDYTAREMGIAIKKGTSVATADYATAPVCIRSTTRWELSLAVINVPKQTTEIKQSMISDTRGNSSLCGYVQGLIQQVGTSTLFLQWQSAFNDWFESVQDQFEAGKVFKKLEGVYTTTSANESTFNVATYIPSYSQVYDILEVFINGFHLNGNEYTLVNGNVVLETPIQKTGAVIDFVVYKSVPEE